MAPFDNDIAIVGGGMVGLSLALMLTNKLPASSVVVVDRHSLRYRKDAPLFQPSFDARTTALSAGSAAILQQTGLWSSLSEHVTSITQVQINDRGFPGQISYKQSDNQGDALGYVVENVWLGQQLMRKVNGTASIATLGDAEISDLQCEHDSVRLHYSRKGQPATIKARLAVIADGAHSHLRDRLGISVERFDYQQSAVIANVGFEKPHFGVAYERFTEAGPLALLPLGESSQARIAALVWTHTHAEAERVMGLSDTDFLAALQAAFGYRLGSFHKVSERRIFPLQRLIAKEQYRRRLVLAGNAAHYLHPVAGQGFNLALRDCAALSHVLQKAEAKGEDIGAIAVLERYMAQQRADQDMTSMLSHSFNRIFTQTRPWVRASRNLALFGLGLLPSLRQRFFEQMLGKGILHQIIR